MDMNRLSRGEQIFLGASGLLLILAWIPAWAKVSIDAGLLGGLSESGNAWESYGLWGKFVVLLALAGVVIAGLRLAGQKIEVPASAYAGIGAVATLLMLLMVLLGPDVEGADGIPGVDVDRGILLFLGILLGAAMAYGGYLAMQAEGTTSPPTTTPPSV